MRNHTPGPWNPVMIFNSEVEGNAKVVIHAAPKSALHSATKVAEAAFSSVPSGYHVDSREEAEANARLIAAAPETAAERDRLKEINAELLHAIETLLGETDDSYYMLQAERESVARAAIYKAKDRTEQKENQQ